MWKEIILVGLGGGAGSIMRYLTVAVMNRYFWPSPDSVFPTMTVNFFGCFLAGLFFALFQKYNGDYAGLSLLLIVGFCGGYTTFSAFSYQNFDLLTKGQYLPFIINVAGSLVLGILAVAAAWKLVRMF